MKISVTYEKKNNRYLLKIDDTVVLRSEKLSTIVNRLEDDLKKKFLPQTKKEGVAGKVGDKLGQMAENWNSSNN